MRNDLDSPPSPCEAELEFKSDWDTGEDDITAPSRSDGHLKKAATALAAVTAGFVVFNLLRQRAA